MVSFILTTESVRFAMKFKVTAVIPTQQYGNIQPCIEVEADTFEKAHAEVMPLIEQLWGEYGEKPLSKHGEVSGTITTQTKRLKDFFGNEIDYDEVNHIYSWKGEIYESGSQYAKKFEKPFDGKAIAAKMATKYGVKAEDISRMWELKARTSREFGTALHSALELCGAYNSLAVALERETHLHDHPVIKSAVESFYHGRKDEKAEYEVLIVDHKAKRAGRIDRLLITGDKTGRVQDLKFNAIMTPNKLKVYWEQLKFYSGIVQANGWQTEPEDIFHYNGDWKTYSKEQSNAD